MRQRSIFGIMLVMTAMLLLAAPALAGGWAVITLDSLPRDVRAGQSLRLGFVIRQHGRELVNNDWEGHALKPVLTARKQADSTGAAGGNLILAAAHSSAPRAGSGETFQVVARQEGPVGHFVADVVFPSAGTWAWEIAAPPFTIRGERQGDAAVFAPLTVAPATAAPQPAIEQAPATVLGVSPAALRWAGAGLLLVAVGVALAAQRGVSLRRRAMRSS
jgi:hypothetical protein